MKTGKVVGVDTGVVPRHTLSLRFCACTGDTKARLKQYITVRESHGPLLDTAPWLDALEDGSMQESEPKTSKTSAPKALTATPWVHAGPRSGLPV